MIPFFSQQAPAVVAIPAHDEADRIGACLAALAMQRDAAGSPLGKGTFDVLVFANNCRDETAAIARSFAGRTPFGLDVVTARLPPAESNAGGARRAAMDLAADALQRRAFSSRGRVRADGLILTTDADSCVQPTWMAANLAAIERGADAVAGYVDADPDEYLALGAGFLARGRLEDRYLARVAELFSLLDPRRHDPWPNHRVNSGASFAVTLSAYRAIGGLPSRPLGEDSALAHALENAGFLIRHSMDAVVTTSCRFDSRAAGGAGDTMRARHVELDAPCDDDLETIDRVFRRAGIRGRMRRLHAAGRLGHGSHWAARLALDQRRASHLAIDTADLPFARLWQAIEAESPVLQRSAPLRPSHLPREIERADRLLRRLHGVSAGGSAGRDDSWAGGVRQKDEAAAILPG